MTSVGIMASAVGAVAASVFDGEIINEPFDALTAWTITGSPTIVAGRNGTCVENNSSTDVLTCDFPTTPIDKRSDYVVVGFAFRWTDASGISVVREFAYLKSTAGATLQHRLTFDTTGALSITRSNTVIATSAPLGLVANTWYYLEFKFRLHDSLGYIVARLNGTEVISATGLDTNNNADPVVYDQFELNTNTSGLVHQIDDLYLAAGPTQDFKGDHVASAEYPWLFAAGTLAAVGSGTTITPTMPAGIAANDVAIMPIMANTTTTLTLPGGWTELGTPINNADQVTKWCWKRLTGSEGNPTVTAGAAFSTSNGGYARIYVFRNCITSGDPFEDVTMAGAPTNSTAILTAAITTTGEKRLAVCFVMVDDDNVISINPVLATVGWQQLGTNLSSGTGGDASFHAIAKAMPDAADLAAVTFYTMGAADFWRTMTLALIPEPPAEGLSDDFNRADGALGSPWSVINGSVAISGNAAVATTAGTDCAAMYDEAVANDQYAECTVALTGSGGYRDGGPATRMSSPSGDFYYKGGVSHDGQARIFKNSGGSYTQIGSTAGVSVETHVVKLESIGTTHKLYIDGIERVSGTDSELTSGRVGMVFFHDTSGVTVDDWSGGAT